MDWCPWRVVEPTKSGSIILIVLCPLVPLANGPVLLGGNDAQSFQATCRSFSRKRDDFPCVDARPLIFPGASSAGFYHGAGVNGGWHGNGGRSYGYYNGWGGRGNGYRGYYGGWGYGAGGVFLGGLLGAALVVPGYG